MIIYLGRLLPNASSGTSRCKKAKLFCSDCLSTFARDTALHRGKDLAVSFVRRRTPVLTWIAPARTHCLSVSAVSARTSRLTADGRYPLPSCIISAKALSVTFRLSRRCRCSDFPPLLLVNCFASSKSDHLDWSEFIILQITDKATN